MKGEKAAAVWFTGPGSVEIREETVEKNRGELLVHSKLIGISHGTEMLVYNGELPEDMETDATLKSLRGELTYPLKYGYINAGITGEGKKVFAFYPHQTLFAVPEQDALILPDDLEYEDAVFTAHMETAVSVIQDASPLIGERALIVGLGTVGLLTAEILCLFPLTLIIAIDPYSIRRERAEKLGCTTFSPEESDLPEKIRKLSGGKGVDMAINVSGSDRGLQLAIDALCYEGRAVEASWYGSRKVQLELGNRFHRQRLTVRSSQVSNINPTLAGRWDKKRRMACVLDLLERVRPSKYITHRFALHNASDAFEQIHKRPDETIQAVLVP